MRGQYSTPGLDFRFDITDYLKESGENSVSVEVYRSSDGSFLEAQDMFRLPGIFRSTYLTAFPKVQISDLVVRTMELGSGSGAIIRIDRKLNNLTEKVEKGLKMTYTVYPVGLYSDETSDSVRSVSVNVVPIEKGGTALAQTLLNIRKPLFWSAEAPYRYVLVAELKDKKGDVLDCTSTYFGIRTVEIHDTKANDDEFGLAGRYFYVNGQPVKLKGVNLLS